MLAITLGINRLFEGMKVGTVYNEHKVGKTWQHIYIYIYLVYIILLQQKPKEPGRTEALRILYMSRQQVCFRPSGGFGFPLSLAASLSQGVYFLKTPSGYGDVVGRQFSLSFEIVDKTPRRKYDDGGAAAKGGSDDKPYAVSLSRSGASSLLSPFLTNAITKHKSHDSCRRFTIRERLSWAFHGSWLVY